MLTKEQFFTQYRIVTTHPVTMPDGGVVHVRELSGHDRTQFEIAISKAENLASVRERLVVLCACDEGGKRLFEDSDTTSVGLLPVSVIEPIFAKARDVNGLNAAPPEDTRKNSETTPRDILPFASV